MKIKRLYQNDIAVSPIVATLVLLVVAIAGAAAVGTILGSFSGEVSGEVSSEGAASAASTEILVGGSTSVAPLAESLKSGFESKHPGTKITIQQGGDTTGIAATGMDIIDIALLSREMTSAEKTKYPDLHTQWIGGSAVMLIAGEKITTFDPTQAPQNTTQLTPSQIKGIYNAISSTDSGMVTDIDAASLNISGTKRTASLPSPMNITVYKRAETRSGPEYIFSKFIAEGNGDFIASKNAVAVTGDEGMIEAISNNPYGIGFVDYRFALEAKKSGKINILAIYDNVGGSCNMKQHCVDDIPHMQSHVKAALNGNAKAYPAALLNNMYMVTNGWPSSVEARFINFAQQPSSINLYSDAGYYSLLEINQVEIDDGHY
ncbi:substrate-binding domain-containing protein [Methanolobus psychrotolerans]|uniref:substrate-binding domain-containing protein n=1 Tax=Methanolobus psychrotolerans TaxID=1874706 RepID=UPI000B91730B|nr:substrate-binding domain-containing protein [Methanolobus psychrotolerans]